MRNIYGQIFIVIMCLICGCKSQQTSSAAYHHSAEVVTAKPLRASAIVQSDPVFPKGAFILLAEYVDAEGQNSRDIWITGRNFKTDDPTTFDCMESIDGGIRWTPCARIIKATSTEYDVVAFHSAAWPQVWVKVRGSDELFSNFAVVTKYSRAVGNSPMPDQASHYTQSR